MSKIRMDKTGASLTGGEGIDIFPVVEKTDLRRSRVVQRGDIPRLVKERLDGAKAGA